MQGERSILEPFPENIDLNQGSGSNNAVMDRSAAWNNLLNPVESRLSNYVLSAGEGNADCVNPASCNGRTSGGWDPGESSSNANVQSQLNGHDLKMGQGWSPSMITCVAADGRAADWQFEQPNVFHHESNSNGFDGNYFSRPLSIRSPVSACSRLNTSTSGGSYQSSNDASWQGREAGLPPNFYRPGRSEMDCLPTFGFASDDVGTSSGSSGYLVQHDDASGSSSSSWGLSCKRKALEGNPGQSSSSGNLSMDPQDETVGSQTIPARYNASSSLTVGAPSMNLQSASNAGRLNPRMGSGMTRVTCDEFPPLSVSEVAESSERNFGFRANLGQQDSVPFDIPAAGADVRHSNVHSARHQSSLISTTESPGFRAPFSRSVNSNNTLSQSHLMQVPGSTGNILPFPWNGSHNSRGSASSGPISFSGERGAISRDETSFRNSLNNNNREHSSFVSAPETRHMVQEPTGWSFSPGNAVSSRNVPSGSRTTPSSGARPLPTGWMPYQNPAAHNQQRLSELPPWALFPPVEPEPGGQRGQFSLLPSASSSSEEAVMSSGSSSGDHIQPYSRSLLMESDDINGWRALAAGIEGRHRIVSEVSLQFISHPLVCISMIPSYYYYMVYQRFYLELYLYT